jgi:hypothetical protein
MTGLPTSASLPRTGASVVAGSGSISGTRTAGHGSIGNGNGAGSNGHNGNGQGGSEQRQRLLVQADELNGRARACAEEGDIEASAQLILKSLDCERRAGGLGPQVLQLIKPRT